VAGGDRGLEDIGTRYAAQPGRAVERGERVADERPVPTGAVLVEEQDRLTVTPDTGAGPRRLDLHERQQPEHLRLARRECGEHAAEADRLLHEVTAHPVAA
jgi:hypothetical protein